MTPYSSQPTKDVRLNRGAAHVSTCRLAAGQASAQEGGEHGWPAWRNQVFACRRSVLVLAGICEDLAADDGTTQGRALLLAAFQVERYLARASQAGRAPARLKNLAGAACANMALRGFAYEWEARRNSRRLHLLLAQSKKLGMQLAFLCEESARLAADSGQWEDMDSDRSDRVCEV